MKDKQVIVRLSEDEKAAFTKAAELKGISLSSWARMLLRAAAQKELEKAGKVVQFNKADQE